MVRHSLPSKWNNFVKNVWTVIAKVLDTPHPATNVLPSAMLFRARIEISSSKANHQ